MKMVDDLEFYVLQINISQYTMRVTRSDTMGDVCKSKIYTNTSINRNIFHYVYPVDENVNLFYNCTGVSSPWKKYAFHCSSINQEKEVYFLADQWSRNGGGGATPSCENVKVVVLQENLEGIMAGKVALQEAVDEGFVVGFEQYKGECDECVKSNGVCGSDLKVNGFVCHCRHRTQPRVGSKGLCKAHIFFFFFL